MKVTVAETQIVDAGTSFGKRCTRTPYAVLTDGHFVSQSDHEAIAVLDAANASGIGPSSAMITVRSGIVVTDKVRAKANDYLIGATARLFDLATGERVDGSYMSELLADCHPAFRRLAEPGGFA